MPNRALIILRLVFLLAASLIGIYIVRAGPGLTTIPWLQWAVLGGVIAMALGLIALDIVIPHKALDTISSVYFGLIVGLFLTYVVALGMEGLPIQEPVGRAIRLVLGMVLCYGCISLLLQTKN